MKDFTTKGPVKFPCKRDAHPKKGWKNWWEDMGFYKSKTAKRQALRKMLSLEYNTDTSAEHPVKGEDIVRYSFEKRRVWDKEPTCNN